MIESKNSFVYEPCICCVSWTTYKSTQGDYPVCHKCRRQLSIQELLGHVPYYKFDIETKIKNNTLPSPIFEESAKYDLHPKYKKLFPYKGKKGVKDKPHIETRG